MLRLLYISTARVPIDRAGLGQILRTSRSRNAAAAITGLLVAGERRFLQTLEGPADAVEATFDRIQCDPRHFGVVVLSRAETRGRMFGEWAMGCQSSVAGGGSGTVAADVEALIDRIRDPNTRAEFTAFAHRHAA